MNTNQTPKYSPLYWAAHLSIASGIYLAITAPDWQEALYYGTRVLVVIVIVLVAKKLWGRV